MVFEYHNSGIYALADQKIFSLWTMINYVHWVNLFDLLIEKDCVSDLSGPASCRIGPVRQVAGPENAAI